MLILLHSLLLTPVRKFLIKILKVAAQKLVSDKCMFLNDTSAVTITFIVDKILHLPTESTIVFIQSKHMLLGAYWPENYNFHI